MIAFFIDWYKRNLSNPAAFILILQFITAFVVLYFFSNIFGTLIAALVLAFMLERPVNFLIRHNLSRLQATVAVMLGYVVFFVGLFLVIIPPAAEQMSKITATISSTLTEISYHGSGFSPAGRPDGADAATAKIFPAPGDIFPLYGQVTDGNVSAPAAGEGSVSLPPESPGPLPFPAFPAPETPRGGDAAAPGEPAGGSGAADPAPAGKAPSGDGKAADGYVPHPMNERDKKESTAAMSWLSAKVKSFTGKLPEAYKDLVSENQLQEYTASFVNQFRKWLTPILTDKIAPIFMDLVSMLVYFVIVPIFSFYMLKDKDKLLALTRKYLCSHREVLSFWGEMNVLVSKYLTGKCIHVVIIFAVNWIAFSILNLNYALLLGIGVGLSVIIPYVGMVIITIPILVIGVMQFGMSADMAWLIGVYTVIQILDGYALTPMLFSETLNLDPFFILVAIVVFGGLLGFWGVVLAIPLATFVKTVFTRWPVNRAYIAERKAAKAAAAALAAAPAAPEAR